LRRDVERLCGFGPRSFEQTRTLADIANWIREELSRAGLSATLESFRTGRGPYANVVAKLPGASDRTPTLVVGAHYDGCGATPGADDNGSGIAALLALGRWLGTQKTSTLFTIELVAYSLEEPPFFGTPEMGSAFHARARKAAGVSLAGMISLEMLGYFSDEPSSQQFPTALLKALYPSRGNFLMLAGNWRSRAFGKQVARWFAGGTQLPIHRLNAPDIIPGIQFSDHRNYGALGIPALMLTDTAFYRNPHYHEPSDLPDTLDYERMREAVLGIQAIVSGFLTQNVISVGAHGSLQPRL